jgi:hypothetical protein
MTILIPAVKACARAAAVFMFVALGGCASFYVDSSLKEVTPADKVAVANPQPVQLLFEFQTKGVRNGQATDMLRDTVTAAVKDSGLFSQVGDQPVANGALVSVTLNNVPLTDDAFAKGFMTGFTLGLVGNTVGDGYICTIDYSAGPSIPKLTITNRNAIYTSLGATSGPKQPADKMKSADEAAKTMTRRTIANGLNDLAKNPDFAKTAVAAKAATP